MFAFRAMNTDVAIAAPTLDPAAEQRLAQQAARLFADTERRFSRFVADSELGRLNRATGSVVVSRELMELLCAAGRHVVETEGLFDPTIGGALRAAGYDRSFSPGTLDHDAPPARAPPAHFAELAIDEPARLVRRPPHLSIDLGGFLKGRTVDHAAALAPAPAMVDAGGDAMLRGNGPDGTGWLVEIEDPADARHVLATLRLRDRAVATSAPNRRRWRAGDRAAHHLIDPRTGEPSRSDLAQVTVVAATAEQADVLAKVVFLLGATDGARRLDGQPGLGGALVTRDGSLLLVGDLEVADA
ncbi:MAG: ApbE family lipoprotein [Deltaproteobacteria bacterium]|nr:ApbE family lipoprotein [Deltaproteobacteria bacterium]